MQYVSIRLRFSPGESACADPGIRIAQRCQGMDVLSDVPVDGRITGDLTFRLEAGALGGHPSWTSRWGRLREPENQGIRKPAWKAERHTGRSCPSGLKDRGDQYGGPE